MLINLILKTNFKTMITIQHIYKFSETKEITNFFNSVTKQWETIPSIAAATALVPGKKMMLSSDKDYCINISIVRQYENGKETKKLIYSH